MSYFYNITFITAKERKDNLIEYLKTVFIDKICNDNSPAKNPDMRIVIETGGEAVPEDHGVSIAVGILIEKSEDVYRWQSEILSPALSEFSLKFGEEAVFFTTLMENLLG